VTTDEVLVLAEGGVDELYCFFEFLESIVIDFCVNWGPAESGTEDESGLGPE